MCVVLDFRLKDGELQKVSNAQFSEIVSDRYITALGADKTLTPAVVGRLTQLLAYSIVDLASLSDLSSLQNG
jgi:hypothetical protein